MNANCEPMIDLANVVFDHDYQHFEYIVLVYDLYIYCLVGKNHVLSVMLAWFLLFGFFFSIEYVYALHIIVIILKQQQKKEIKSGLRITRTGQFTVIHHQKRRRRKTNDEKRTKERRKKKDVQRPQ
jgi:hypothetical protein